MQNDFFSGLSQELMAKSNPLLERIKKDNFFFAREIMNNEPVFPISLSEEDAGDWAKLFDYMYKFANIEAINDEEGIRLGVVNSPRNSLKTTLLLSRIVNLIGFDRNIRILYTTNVHDNAVNFSRRLVAELETNQKLRDAFGDFKPVSGIDETDSWRLDYFFVSGRTTSAREPTFTASSVGKTKVGQHYDIIIIDDACDIENTRTAESIKNLIDWFRATGSLRDKKSRYGPGGCILVNGTRWADADLYGFLLGEVVDDKDKQWKNYTSLVLRSIENPVWDEENQRFVNPQLNFPHILTEKLLNEERTRGLYYFSTQYQNECVPSDDAHFKTRWFHIIKPYDIPQDLRYYIFTDFAFGLNDENDRTAIWVVGLDWERKAYCVDFDVGRWSLYERCHRVIALAAKYDVCAMSIEKVVSNEGIKSTLERMRDEYRLRLRIQEISGRTTESKMMRIVSMQPRFEQGRIFFSERDPMDNIGIRPEFISIRKDGTPEATCEILKEFIRFPRATHDDIPDALSDIDKIDPTTKTYYFPGSGRYSGEHSQFKGPTVVNGHIVYQETMGINSNAREQGKAKADFWSRSAERLKGNGRRWI